MADASVKVVVQAITEAAEEAIDDVGDQIEQVSGSAQTAKKGLSSLENTMNEAARSAVALSGAIGTIGRASARAIPGVKRLTANVDDMGDEATASAAQLGILRSSMFALADATDTNVHGASLMMGAFSSLIPVIAALGAALVPLIGYLGVAAGAFGGLAIGMGAIVGTGVIADLNGIKAALKEMKKEVKAVAADFGSKFTPMIYDAINAFPTFLDRVLDSINGIKQFKQALRDLGSWAMSGIPAIVSELTSLGKQALPVLRDLASFVRANAQPAFNALTWSLKLTAQQFKDLGAAIPGFLNALLKVGTQVLQYVIPAITSLIKSMTRLYQLFQNPPTQFETVVTLLLSSLAQLFQNIGRVYSALQPLLKQLAIFSAIVVGVAATLLNKMTPAIIGIIGELTRLMRWVNRGIIGFGKWAKQSKTVQRTLKILGGAATTVTNKLKTLLSGGVNRLRGSLPKLKSMLLGALRTFNRLASGSISLRTAFNKLRKSAVQTTKGAVKFVTNMNRVEKAVSRVHNRLRPFVNTLRTQLGPAFKVIAGVAAAALAIMLRGPLFAAVTKAAGGFKRLALMSNTLKSGLNQLKIVGNMAMLLFGVWGGLIKSQILGVLGRLASKLGIVRTAISFLLPSLGTLGTVFSTLLSPIALVAAAVVGLYIAWKKNLFGIRDTTRRVFAAVKALLRGDTSKAKNLVGDAAAKMKKAWKGLKQLWKDTKRIFNKVLAITKRVLGWIYTNAVKPILNSIMQHWNQHGTEIMESMKELFNFLKMITKITLGILMKAWQMFGDEILAVTKFTFDLIGSVINTALDVLITAFDVFTDVISGDYTEAFNKLAGLTERILGGIVSFVWKWGSGLVKAFGNIVGDVIGWFKDLGSSLIWGSIIPNILGDIISAVKNWDIAGTFKGAVRGAVNAITNLGGDFLSAGKGLVGSLVDGIRNKIDDVRSAAGDVASAVDKYMPGSDADKGPLSNLSSYGPEIMEMISSGMLKNMRSLQRAASRVAQAAMPPARPMGTGGGGGTSINVGGIRVKVDGDKDGKSIGRDIGRGLDDELRSRGFN